VVQFSCFFFTIRDNNRSEATEKISGLRSNLDAFCSVAKDFYLVAAAAAAVVAAVAPAASGAGWLRGRAPILSRRQ